MSVSQLVGNYIQWSFHGKAVVLVQKHHYKNIFWFLVLRLCHGKKTHISKSGSIFFWPSCIKKYIFIKWFDFWLSVVTHTLNLCSASAHTHPWVVKTHTFLLWRPGSNWGFRALWVLKMKSISKAFIHSPIYICNCLCWCVCRSVLQRLGQTRT